MVTPAASNTAAILVNKAIKQRKSRRTGRSLTIALIIGFLFVIVGIIPIATFNPTPFAGPPTCNGETMNPGDTCQEFTNGVLTGTYDYDQMLAMEQPDRAVNYGWGFSLIAIGALTLGLGAYNLNPKRPWGKGRAEPCPKCGRLHLRDKLMRYQTPPRADTHHLAQQRRAVRRGLRIRDALQARHATRAPAGGRAVASSGRPAHRTATLLSRSEKESANPLLLRFA